MNIPRMRAILVVAVALAIPASALAKRAAVAATHTVLLKNIRYTPATLSIKRGDTVRWLWRDGPTEHNVTGTGFKSRTQASGSFSVRFTRRGTFNYHCTIHASEGMRGRVIVH